MAVAAIAAVIAAIAVVLVALATRGPSRPANDNIDRAAEIGAASTLSGTTARASWQPDEPPTVDARGPGGDVWYAWQPAVSGRYDFVDVSGSSPTVEVLSGSSLGSLAALPAQRATGALEVSAVAGRTYRLAVRSARSGGAFTIAVQPAGGGSAAAGAPPANDDLADAQDLTGELSALPTGRPGALIDGTTLGATVQPGETHGSAAPHSVWYSADLPAAVVGHRLSLAVAAQKGSPALSVSVGAGSPSTPIGSVRPLVSARRSVSLVVPSGARRLVIRIAGPAETFRLSGAVSGFRRLDTSPPVVTCASPPNGWTRRRTISCTAHDAGGSGLRTARHFTLPVGVPKGQADSSAATPSRQICDKAGNCASVAPMTGIEVDLSAPEVVCDPAPGSWSGPGQAKTHCRSADTGSGLADPADASFWLHTSVPFGSTDPAARFSRHAAVCDKAGNCTNVTAPRPAAVDRQPPTVSCGKAQPGWTDVQGHVTCSASDAGSGLLTTSDGSFTLSTDVAPGVSTPTARTATQKVCDRAGNCARVGPIGVFSVDRSAPHVHCSSSPRRWIAATRWVARCTASDAGSGLAAGGQAHFALTATIAAGAERRVQTGSRQVCDAAGNCVTAGPVVVRLDDRAPVVTCGTVPAQWQPEAVRVQCSASDQGSGLAPGTPATVTLRATGTPGDTERDVTLPRHTFCDGVGHCATTPRLRAGRIDQQAPLARCGNVPAGVNRGQVSVRCVVTDDGSGLANPAQSQVALVTEVPSGEVDRHAATTTVTVCDAVGNCARVGPLYADVDMQAAPTAPPPRFSVDRYSVSAYVDASTHSRAVVTFPLPSATGTGVRVTCNPAPGSAFPVGVVDGACAAVDTAGRTTTIPMTVTTRVRSAAADPPARLDRVWRVGATGFGPKAPLTLEIDATAVGTARADRSGDAVVGFRMPRTVGPGLHVLDLAGPGPGGRSVVEVHRLRVARSGPARLPTFGGSSTALGRLAASGHVSVLRALRSEAAPGGPRFGGGVPVSSSAVVSSLSGGGEPTPLLAAACGLVVVVLGGGWLWWRRRREPISRRTR